MKLLTLVLLLSAFSSLTLSEVTSFNSCSLFFIPNPEKQNDNIIPSMIAKSKNSIPKSQYKKICQRWKNNYRFATMYDTVRRIPVYSAYTFSTQKDTTRKPDWKIEPQLENIEEYKEKNEMMDSPREAGNIINQAVYSDYRDIVYSRGHVFPYSYAANQDQADSTFTLTNIAPQTQDNNRAWAREVEEPMLKVINNNCRLDQNHKAYIVTGVVPGNNWIPITRGGNKNEKGINIPSHFWSAFCCTSVNNINILISKAYIAELENFKVRTPTIDNLNKRLTELYDQDFSVFPRLSCEIIKPPL